MNYNMPHPRPVQHMNKCPTFRAKGVVESVGQVDAQHPNFLYAKVKIGNYSYNVPVCRNTEEGDVLEIKINRIKVSKNYNS